jgi:hypothetical protein
MSVEKLFYEFLEFRIGWEVYERCFDNDIGIIRLRIRGQRFTLGKDKIP